jgi:hypothetical protein
MTERGLPSAVPQRSRDGPPDMRRRRGQQQVRYARRFARLWAAGVWLVGASRRGRWPHLGRNRLVGSCDGMGRAAKQRRHDEGAHQDQGQEHTVGRQPAGHPVRWRRELAPDGRPQAGKLSAPGLADDRHGRGEVTRQLCFAIQRSAAFNAQTYMYRNPFAVSPRQLPVYIGGQQMVYVFAHSPLDDSTLPVLPGEI